jgi:hypothetical protein
MEKEKGEREMDFSWLRENERERELKEGFTGFVRKKI